MASIRPLSESARSSVRSGIFLFDLTRVVEELVFNSLDAGARKVSVFVSIGSCYVKVVDDGAGITRDGLVLVGERYATSKFLNLADLDATSGSFGFRGEALASISEVSLLEIVTRTYGIPNGYRKVLKGCRCVYFGIDDERKEVGTTVVVRDLFYNQPVRRKYMQSSLKKVLQSVKKCVLRLALVHPNILYKVVDIESEAELLCTHSSSSPLSLLSSGFGVEVSSSLRELQVQDDNIKLCGYISGPCNSFSLKALQYVCPIHKLLSQLAIRFEYLNSWNAENGFQNKKRTRSQPCPAYILNLTCPRSLYDVTFEPSKTYVQFKDWTPILDFIEKAIKQFWEENLPHGEFSNHATYMIRADKMWKEGDMILSEAGFFGADMSNCRNQNGMDCLDLFSSTADKLTKDNYQLSDHEDRTTSVGYLHKGTEKFKEQVKRDFLCQTNYSCNSLNGSYTKCLSTLNKKHDGQLIHDNNGLSEEDYFLDSKFSGEESFKVNAAFDAPSSSHGNKSIKDGTDEINKSSEVAFVRYSHELCNDLKINRNIQMPFLKSCSRQGSVLHKRSLFVNDENEVLNDSFMSKQHLGMDCGSVKDLLSHTRPEVVKNFNMTRDSDILSRAFTEENLVFLDSCYSATQMEGSGSDHQLLDPEWYSVYHEPLSLATLCDVDHMSDHYDIEGMPRYHKMDSFVNLLGDDENECNFSYKISGISSQDHCSSSFVKTGFDFGCPADPSKIFYGIINQPEFSDMYSTKWLDTSTDESDWLCLESDTEKFQRLGKNRSKRDHFSHSTIEKKHSRRSSSAPPFCRRKRRFVSSNQLSIFLARTPTGLMYNRVLNNGEAYEFKHPKQSFGSLQLSTEDQLLPKIIPNVKKRLEIVADTEANTIRGFDNFQNFNIRSSTPFEDFIDYKSKWRNCSPQLPKNDDMLDTQTLNNILDISSGFLHLAGDSLIPESISKNSLEDAKVLHQVDKKFIPIVAGRTLAIIDQHAADERIRLEELRQKVLSGEATSITCLDAEKELVLPEIGYQLLHNYAEQVKDWGWICNIHTQDSKSFKRNLAILNRQPMVVILIAVPCILGVKLNDVDLMEFLQQLADTDGSSTIPPSVIRVLNMKACRGAIMFGDSLLPSECSLLVEELKHTSLCFQCAHGRPTTAPVVNLEALHSQIAKLGLTNDCSNNEWHGLRRHKICVERAAKRLCSAEEG